MPRYDGVEVHIACLPPLATTDKLVGFEFVNCLIIGPAIIAVLDRVSLVNNTFEGEPSSILWEIPLHKTVLGPVGVTDCSFTNCTFRAIGLAGPPDFIAKFRLALSQAQAQREAQGQPQGSPAAPQAEPAAH